MEKIKIIGTYFEKEDSYHIINIPNYGMGHNFFRAYNKVKRILQSLNISSWYRDKIIRRSKRSVTIDFNDPRFKNQWYVINSYNSSKNYYGLNVLNAWKTGFTGKGVRICILDDGLDINHIDISSRYFPQGSYNFVEMNSNPTPHGFRDTHGTRCAGLASAVANNSFCGIGVAFNSRIGAIRMLSDSITDAIEFSSLSYGQDINHIYSMSWGPYDEGIVLDGPGNLAKIALKNGISKGRNKLGSIFVWALGNGGHNDHCGADGYIQLIETIGIGSILHDGTIPWFSERCSAVIAVTPTNDINSPLSSLITIDINNECTTSHTGTSASAPLAAGVIALLLEANPYLTWRDVQNVLIQTSKIVNNQHFSWKKNGVNRFYSDYFGYGLLDSQNAIDFVKNQKFTYLGNQNKCYYSIPNQIYLKNKGFIISSIYLYGCIKDNPSCVTTLEHVVIILTVESNKRGAIEVSIISPSGFKSTLLSSRILDNHNGGLIKWQLLTVANWGESANGLWILVIENVEMNNIITLKEWSIELYGTCENYSKEIMLNKCELYKKPCLDEYLISYVSNNTSLDVVIHEMNSYIKYHDNKTIETRKNLSDNFSFYTYTQIINYSTLSLVIICLMIIALKKIYYSLPRFSY